MNYLKSFSKNKKYSLGKIIAIVFFIFYIGGNIYINIKPKVISFIAEWALREYNDDITKCISTTKEELNGKKVSGIEYECAIKVAATFYNSNPEKAIQLCMINNPFFDIQLKRKYSSFKSEDFYTQNNEQIARIACKSGIEKSVKENKISTKDLSTIFHKNIFSNDKYGYTISILPSEIITSNEHSTQATKAFSISINNKKGDFIATITALTPSMFLKEDEKKIRESLRLPLKEYVKYISEINKNSLDLPMRESQKIDGVSGYTFSIQNYFQDETGEYPFTNEYPIHSFIFLEHKGIKYQLEIPEALGHRGGEILNSLKFQS